MSAYVARFHDGDRTMAAVCRPAVKRLHVCFLDDSGVRVASVPLEEERYTQRLDYTVEKAAKKFRGMGRRRGITQAAKDFLEALAHE